MEVARDGIGADERFDTEVFKPFAVGAFDMAVQVEAVCRFSMPGVHLVFAFGTEEEVLLSPDSLSASAGGVCEVEVIDGVGYGLDGEVFLTWTFGEVVGRILSNAVGTEPICETLRGVGRANEEIERS